MPRYEYACPQDHRTEVNRPVADRDAPLPCTAEVGGRIENLPGPARWIKGTPCGAETHRVLSTPASAFPGADSWRQPPKGDK